MKVILLEHPRNISPEHCNDIANTPLSSCLLTGYAAAVLRAGEDEVEIVDGHLEGLGYEQLAGRIRAGRPDLLAVHLIYQWRIDHGLFDLLAALKEEGLGAHVTAYGFYPTFAAGELLLTCPFFDSVIVGEPEFTMAELARTLAGRGDTGEVPGLALRKASGGMGYRRRPPVEDLDALPFPVRSQAGFRLAEVNVQGSRGCYGRCTFCYVNSFYGEGSRWRRRSPENIVAEIDQIIAEQKAGYFYFVDPNFFGPGEQGQKRALHLAALLKTRNIRFGLEGRVNDIHEETIYALVEAGLTHILIGLESGSDHALKRMQKMTTVVQNERAIGILRRYGLEPNIGFIMFEPYSSLADIRTNFAFLQRNGLLGDLAITSNVLYHHQIILRGTPCYQELLRQGCLESAGASDYEARTIFADQEVATLAAIMRRITNHIFLRMAGIFSGRAAESEKSAKLNGMLLNWFVSLLRDLENRQLGPETAANFAGEAVAEIDRVLREG